MKHLLLDAEGDREKWDGFFGRLPSKYRDVHFTSAYARIQLLAEAETSEAVLAVSERGEDFVMQPFMLRRIDGNHFDVGSLYGYGGAVGTVVDCMLHPMLAVSEYCSLHPMCLSYGEVVDLGHRKVVHIELDSFESNLNRSVRRALVKARNAKISVNETPDMIPVFHELYRQLMEAKGSAKHWQFPLKYFFAHEEEKVGAMWFFAMLPMVGIVRGLLTIGIGEVAYAHFLGSDGKCRHLGVDELLYFEAAVKLRELGFKFFHLGGGTTNEPDDSLFTFKSGFSKNRLNAHRLGRVLNKIDYDALVRDKIESEYAEHGRPSMSKWFPAYRRPFE